MGMRDMKFYNAIQMQSKLKLGRCSNPSDHTSRPLAEREESTEYRYTASDFLEA
jgi:hypothetical protein